VRRTCTQLVLRLGATSIQGRVKIATKGRAKPGTRPFASIQVLSPTPACLGV